MHPHPPLPLPPLPPHHKIFTPSTLCCFSLGLFVQFVCMFVFFPAAGEKKNKIYSDRRHPPSAAHLNHPPSGWHFFWDAWLQCVALTLSVWPKGRPLELIIASACRALGPPVHFTMHYWSHKWQVTRPVTGEGGAEHWTGQRAPRPCPCARVHMAGDALERCPSPILQHTPFPTNPLHHHPNYIYIRTFNPI